MYSWSIFSYQISICFAYHIAYYNQYTNHKNWKLAHTFCLSWKHYTIPINPRSQYKFLWNDGLRNVIKIALQIALPITSKYVRILENFHAVIIPNFQRSCFSRTLRKKTENAQFFVNGSCVNIFSGQTHFLSQLFLLVHKLQFLMQNMTLSNECKCIQKNLWGKWTNAYCNH